jgi:hypothetical protein
MLLEDVAADCKDAACDCQQNARLGTEFRFESLRQSDFLQRST